MGALDIASLLNEGQDANQEHPNALDDGAFQYGERNQGLPQELQDALKEEARTCNRQEPWDRRREVIRDRRNRFYERGHQHVYDDKKGYFSEATPGGVIANVNGYDIECSDYVDNYNIFQPNLRTIAATLTQNPPGIDFQPKNPSRDEDLQAAATAEGTRHAFDRANDVKGIQTDIARMMCLSGRTVLWVRTEANAQKFGIDEDGKPKSAEISTVHGTLETKCPITARCLEECVYFAIFDDPNVRIAKSEYPCFAKKIQPSAGSSSLGEQDFERYARLGILQGARGQGSTGEAWSHIVQRTHIWFRPAAFQGDRYDEIIQVVEEPPIKLGDKMRQLYPDGCHAVFVGSTYVGSWNESMDDALVVGFPYPGDGMSRMACMDPAIPFQDTVNDQLNGMREFFNVGWPSLWIDGDEVEIEAYRRQRAAPGAIRQVKNPERGAPIAAAFFAEQFADLPESMQVYLEKMSGEMLQFVLATPPALLGGQMSDQKTASGYAQARAQAMGQLGLIWGSIQSMFARMYYLAALCASRNPSYTEDIVISTGDGGNVRLDMTRLSKGKFMCYPDQDSSFPESTSAKRSNLQSLLTLAGASPVGMALFESPDNWAFFNRIMGFPELTIDQQLARDKQIAEIEQLLLGSPIPPDPQAVQQFMIQQAGMATAAQATGQPAPPQPKMVQLPTVDESGNPTVMEVPEGLVQPSVGVEDADYHIYEATKCQEWLSSEACRREIAAGNDSGVLNIRLHRLLHLNQAAAMAPPVPPAIPGGGKSPVAPPSVPGVPNDIAAPPGAGGPSL